MRNELINHLCEKQNIKLTQLRRDIFNILFTKNKPMGAYDILEKLKKKRTNAEPPTVYRVLNYFVEKNIIHRIESQNTYICCSHLTKDSSHHQAILFFCKLCQQSYEYESTDVFHSILQFSQQNHLKIDDSLIEINGICQTCFSEN